MSIDEYSLSFDGEMLKRGFWLQIWAIAHDGQQYLYIDHTGDNAWANAPSPLSGFSQHFESSNHVPDNSLLKHLLKIGIKPQACYYRMIAIGPIFDEQLTIHKHEPLRAQVETLASEVAAYLKWRGYDVLGSYRRGAAVKEQLLDEIKSKVMDFVTEP